MSADTQYDCDVNGDGSVTISDVQIVNKYLMGVGYVSAPSVLDVNENLIVDYADAQCVRVTPYLLQFYNNNSNTNYEE